MYQIIEEKGQPKTGGPCHLYGGGAPHYQINTRARGQSSQPSQPDMITTGNRLSNAQEVTLGQSNGSPGDALECPQVQDEHPWLKPVHEEEDESGDSSEDAANTPGGYETNEDEFEEDDEPGSGGPCHLYGGGGAPSTNKYPGTWPTKPANRVQAKPANRPGASSVNQSGARTPTQSGAKPASHPSESSVNQSGASTTTEPGAKSDTQPGAKPGQGGWSEQPAETSRTNSEEEQHPGV